MKTKIKIWIAIISFSIGTTIFGGAPNNLKEFVLGFAVSLLFWSAMLAPSFIAKDK